MFYMYFGAGFRNQFVPVAEIGTFNSYSKFINYSDNNLEAIYCI